MKSAFIFLIAASLVLPGCTAARVLTTRPTIDPSAVSVATPSGRYALDKSHANILFKVTHFGFSNYIGRFNDFDGVLTFDAEDPSRSKLEVTIKTASIDTNNEVLEGKLEDAAMFDAAAHPEVRFVSTAIERTGNNAGLVKGDLTIKGRTHPVTLNVTFNGAAANPLSQKPTLGFSAKGGLKRSTWGLSQWPIAVSDEVELEIEAEFFRAE